MQVFPLVINLIPINVVDDLTGFRARNLPVLPLPTGALRPVAQPKVSRGLLHTMTLAALHRCARSYGNWNLCDRGNHAVSSSHVLAIGKAINFLLVCKQWIAVVSPHLVVTPAHFPCDSGPFAVRAGSANHFPSPSVVRGAMLLHSLVVHQAKAIGSVLSLAAINAARTVLFWWCHGDGLPQGFAGFNLTGSIIPGQRIAEVDQIP
jgi:hypothetical protein